MRMNGCQETRKKANLSLRRLVAAVDSPGVCFLMIYSPRVPMDVWTIIED